jgi:hypothetical protein
MVKVRTYRNWGVDELRRKINSEREKWERELLGLESQREKRELGREIFILVWRRKTVIYTKTHIPTARSWINESRLEKLKGKEPLLASRLSVSLKVWGALRNLQSSSWSPLGGQITVHSFVNFFFRIIFIEKK